MIKAANKILSYNYIPISCNNKKIPLEKQWPTINKNNCLEKIRDNSNIGILTGKISNITVIDIDIKDNGLETWNKLLEINGNI